MDAVVAVKDVEEVSRAAHLGDTWSENGWCKHLEVVLVLSSGARQFMDWIEL
jgi:23S rRNA C2498 (ribose-2'-O)-methylase RlmM